MRKTLGLMAALLVAGTAVADPPPWKEADKDRREAEREWRKEQREADKDRREDWRERAKDEREWEKEQRKAEREWAKDQREAEREWRKAERKAWRELQKDRRQAARERARDGWYDGERWRSYERVRDDYRADDWTAVRRYEAPLAWQPPTVDRIVVFEPGMRLPEPWYMDQYRIAPDPYGLPPPPPRHAWVQVDDDVVLVALASGLVADFVYDIFE